LWLHSLKVASCCAVRLVYTQISPGRIWTTLYSLTYSNVHIHFFKYRSTETHCRQQQVKSHLRLVPYLIRFGLFSFVLHFFCPLDLEICVSFILNNCSVHLRFQSPLIIFILYVFLLLFLNLFYGHILNILQLIMKFPYLLFRFVIRAVLQNLNSQADIGALVQFLAHVKVLMFIDL